jgi:dihydroorotase
MVIEHVTDATTIQWIYGRKNVAGTITPHHLLLTLDDVIGDKLQPHHFCKPIAKRPSDRDVLIKAAFVNTQGKFFLGSDSAPHLIKDKECTEGCAGIFNAPTIIPSLFHYFLKDYGQEAIIKFTSVYGSQFYGLPLNEDQIELVEERWRVPEEVHGVRVFLGGTELNWRINDA